MKVLTLKRRTRIHALAFAPDGALLAGDRHSIRRVDVSSGDAAQVFRYDGPPTALHSGTHRVAVSTVWATLSMPRPATNVSLADLRRPNHTDWVPLLRDAWHLYDLTFCPAGDLIGAAYRGHDSREGRVRVWDTADAKPRHALTYPRPVQSLALGRGGEWFAVAVGFWNQAEVRVYRSGAATPALAFRPKRGRVQKVRSAGDASSFVGLAGARFFSARPGAEPLVTSPADGRGMLRDVAPSPDGRLAVTVGDDRRARTWVVATAELVSAVDWGIGSLSAVAFAPDGLTCAAGGENGQIVVWDVDA